MRFVSTFSVLLLQSLVLISKLPYVTFFHCLLKIMAPEYFEKQEPCLEAGQCPSFAVSAPDPPHTFSLCSNLCPISVCDSL